MLARFRDGNGNQSVVVYTVPPENDAIPVELTRQPTGAAALAPDGQHVLVGTNRGKLLWIDVASLEMIALVELSPNTMFTSATVAADGESVAAAAGAGRIFVCDPRRETVVELETVQDGTSRRSIGDLRFSHDGRSLASCHADGSITVWDLASRKPRQSLARHQKTPAGAAFLPDSRRIISVGHDDRMCIWDIASGRMEWHRECGLNGVNALAVSPDGKIVACGGCNGRIVVWDLELGERKFEFVPTAEVVKDLKFSFDGSTLASGGLEGVVRFYDMQSGAEQPGLIVSRPPIWKSE